jgi:hypothetical protein
MRKAFSLALVILFCFSVVAPFKGAEAMDAEDTVQNRIEQFVPEVQAVGEGLLEFLFKDVYTATLHAPNGQWTGEAPYALEINYKMGLKGQKIAERSVVEMRKIGYEDEDQLERWLQNMVEIFPDVEDGSTLTGIYTSARKTIFFDGIKQIGLVEDPEFGRAFFNIWLSERTSEPELRQALLGKR